jgi:mitogen-activated protein kinase 7
VIGNVRVVCSRLCTDASAFRSAVDEISGETVAIKLVTRIFEKVQLAKRALREVILLRHFSSHENITGLIDVDAISPDFQEM